MDDDGNLADTALRAQRGDEAVGEVLSPRPPERATEHHDRHIVLATRAPYFTTAGSAGQQMAGFTTMVLAAAALAAGAGVPGAHATPQIFMDNAPRIFGGQYASKYEFPGQVYVLTTSRDLSGYLRKIFCGGTIISASWVITAAHCIEGSLHTAVWAGSSNKGNMDLTEAKRIIRHEGYRLYGRNDNNAVNDLGLIEVMKPFVLDNHRLTAIALPKYLEKIKSSSGVLVVGWGRWTYDPNAEAADEWASDKLKKLSVKVIPCPVAYNDTKVICAQSAAGTGICDGDSGGPLLLNGVAYGVISFVDFIDPDPLLDPNEHCNEEGIWAVFMDLAAYRPWIYKHTGI